MPQDMTGYIFNCDTSDESKTIDECLNQGAVLSCAANYSDDDFWHARRVICPGADQAFLFSGCYPLDDPNDPYDDENTNDMTDEQKGHRYIETNSLVHFDQDNIDAHLDANNRLEKWISKQSKVTGKQFTLRRKSTSRPFLKWARQIKIHEV